MPPHEVLRLWKTNYRKNATVTQPKTNRALRCLMAIRVGLGWENFWGPICHLLPLRGPIQLPRGALRMQMKTSLGGPSAIGRLASLPVRHWWQCSDGSRSTHCDMAADKYAQFELLWYTHGLIWIGQSYPIPGIYFTSVMQGLFRQLIYIWWHRCYCEPTFKWWRKPERPGITEQFWRQSPWRLKIVMVYPPGSLNSPKISHFRPRWQNLTNDCMQD